MERKDRKVNDSARDCRLSVTGRESSASEAGGGGGAVAMVMDQPKKGLESKLLDKAGS